MTDGVALVRHAVPRGTERAREGDLGAQAEHRRAANDDTDHHYQRTTTTCTITTSTGRHCEWWWTGVGVERCGGLRACKTDRERERRQRNEAEIATAAPSFYDATTDVCGASPR